MPFVSFFAADGSSASQGEPQIAPSFGGIDEADNGAGQALDPA
jgi:hypothetical protein